MARTPTFYIRFDDTINGESQITYYEFAATTNIDAVFGGVPTSNPIESGVSVADHYFNDNDIVSFNGVLTNIWATNTLGTLKNKQEVKELTSFLSKDFINGLKKRKENGDLFSVIFDKQKITNCLFDALSISKTPSTGSDSWLISFTAQSVQISDQALIIEEVNPEFKRALSAKKREEKAKQEIATDDSKVNRIKETINRSNVL